MLHTSFPRRSSRPSLSEVGRNETFQSAGGRHRNAAGENGLVVRPCSRKIKALWVSHPQDLLCDQTQSNFHIVQYRKHKRLTSVLKKTRELTMYSNVIEPSLQIHRPQLSHKRQLLTLLPSDRQRNLVFPSNVPEIGVCTEMPNGHARRTDVHFYTAILQATH